MKIKKFLETNILSVFILARGADITTTYLHDPTPASELSPVGSWVLSHGGFLSLVVVNIIASSLIFLMAKRIRLPVLIWITILVSLTIAISNLYLYLYLIFI